MSETKAPPPSAFPARAFVSDEELEVAVAAPDRDLHRASAVAKRAVDEIAERLLEPKPVPDNRLACTDVDRQGASFACRSRRVAACNAPEQLTGSDPL